MCVWTHIDSKVFCDSSAVFSQHSKRHALLQEDPNLVFVLQLYLEIQKHMGKKTLTYKKI